MPKQRRQKTRAKGVSTTPADAGWKVAFSDHHSYYIYLHNTKLSNIIDLYNNPQNVSINANVNLPNV